MGCNCKKVKEINDKYGDEKKKGIFDVIIKIGLFLITIVLTLVIVPIVLIIGLFKAFFMKNKTISIPKFLTNPKKYING